ncbi:MAG: diaminopimelate epimerase, partial [uncultured bacterium]
MDTVGCDMMHFTKMHGLGNDFVVIDNRSRTLDITRLPLSKLADRHHGIGFDQLLIIEPATEADFFCRIFNSDGSEAL